ncbi:MAG TPA: hypothetical protein VJ201_09190 [Candidatus Babeliales bacterium]|nr:hypothetical protein [Candidatus Babeliales bacterium]
MRKTVWEYIHRIFFSLLTVLGGSIAFVLSNTGVLRPDIIGTTTLALVILLATSYLVDNARKLDSIENAIKDGFQTTISSLRGVRVIHLTEPENGMVYLAKRIRDAKNRLYHVSLSPPIARKHRGAKELEDANESTLLQNQVRYRYICVFNDKARLIRIRKHLSNPKISKYFVGYFETQPNNVPMLNYLLVDDSEVIVIFPYPYGEPDVWLSIRHPEVVEMFSKYCERLWGDCKKINAKDIEEGLLEKITIGKGVV